MAANDYNQLSQASQDIRTVILRETSIMSYGADPTGISSSATALTNAMAALSSGGVVHLPVGTYQIGGNVSVPANITLHFDSSKIAIPGSSPAVGVTVSGTIDAPVNAQIFSFNPANTSPVYIYGPGPISPMWFGAKGDGATDDTAAIQACFVAAADQEAYGTGWKPDIFFPTGSYNISSAVTLPNYCTVRGERSVINGTNPSANLFDMQLQGAITNMQFVGGASAIQFQNSDLSGNQYNIDLCWFFSQNVACIYSPPTAASIVAVITRCQFNPPAVATANIIVTSVDKMIIEGCEMNPWELTGPAILMNWGKLKIKDLLGAPDPGGYDSAWIEVVSADGIVSNPTTVELESCRLGGEGGGETIVKWNVTPGNNEDNFLSVKNCTLYSENAPMFLFNSLPQYVEIEGNTANGFAIFDTPGIAFNTAITASDVYYAVGYRWKIQPNIPISPTGSSYISDLLLVNRGNDLNTESFSITTGQLVATGLSTALSFAQLTNATAAYSAASNEYGQPLTVASTIASTTIASGSNGQSLPAPGGIIHVADTAGFQVSGTEQILVQTSNGIQYVTYGGVSGNSFTGCGGGTGVMTTGNVVAPDAFFGGGFIGLLGGLDAGLYTVVFEVELDGPAFLRPTLVGCIPTPYNLHSGKHIMSLPLSISPAVASATPWQALYSGYTVGSVVYVNVDGDRVPVLQAVAVPAGGTTGATFTPYSGLGVQFTDGSGDTAITWQCIGTLDIGIGWVPVSASGTISVGRCRIFSGVVDVNTPNTTVVGTAAPASGYWQVGDIVINTAPTSGAEIGWTCTASGTPGTWLGYGSNVATTFSGPTIHVDTIDTYTSAGALTLSPAVTSGNSVIVNNTSTLSSGNLQVWENNGTQVASVDYAGDVVASGTITVGGLNQASLQGTADVLILKGSAGYGVQIPQYLQTPEIVGDGGSLTVAGQSSSSGPGVIIENATTLVSGDIVNFNNNSSTVASVNYAGGITANQFYTTSSSSQALYMPNGSAYIGGDVSLAGAVEQINGSTALTLQGNGAGVVTNSSSALSSGNLLSVENNGSQVAYIDYLGDLSCAAIAATSGVFSGEVQCNLSSGTALYVASTADFNSNINVVGAIAQNNASTALTLEGNGAGVVTNSSSALSSGNLLSVENYGAVNCSVAFNGHLNPSTSGTTGPGGSPTIGSVNTTYFENTLWSFPVIYGSDSFMNVWVRSVSASSITAGILLFTVAFANTYSNLNFSVLGSYVGTGGTNSGGPVPVSAGGPFYASNYVCVPVDAGGQFSVYNGVNIADLSNNTWYCFTFQTGCAGAAS
jgi:hypothetical protein